MTARRTSTTTSFLSISFCKSCSQYYNLSRNVREAGQGLLIHQYGQPARRDVLQSALVGCDLLLDFEELRRDHDRAPIAHLHLYPGRADVGASGRGQLLSNLLCVLPESRPQLRMDRFDSCNRFLQRDSPPRRELPSLQSPLDVVLGACDELLGFRTDNLGSGYLRGPGPPLGG